MKELAMRFSGGKDSTLAALRMAKEYDRIHLLTFSTAMIRDVEKASVNVRKLNDAYGGNKFTHAYQDITPLLHKLYHGRGYFHDLKRYGTLARTPFCTPCDFTMIATTVKYCVDHGIHFACDGGNKTEFAGFLDDWGIPIIQEFARSHGVEWLFPVWDLERADIQLLEEGLNLPHPQFFPRSQPCCMGGGMFANIHLRCYYLRRHGAEKHKQVTSAYLKERIEIASAYIRGEKI